jgi:hypothetical protein
VLIEVEQNEDVYNLEVNDNHNFSINGGLIVHNCRYLSEPLQYSKRTFFPERRLR